MIGAELHRLENAARRLVVDARPRIEAIADALLTLGSLDGAKIYEIATQSQRIRPAAAHEYGQVTIIGGQR
jgi:hypothetical protein